MTMVMFIMSCVAQHLFVDMGRKISHLFLIS